MKTSTIVIIGLVGVAAYLIYMGYGTGISNDLSWSVSSVDIDLGISTDLDMVLSVTNNNSSALTVSMALTAAMNGSTIGTGTLAAVVPPGTSTVNATITINDLSVATQIENALTRGGVAIALSGQGTAGTSSSSFNTTYTL